MTIPLTVVTEAATGTYVVTPVLAAAAGAEVFAVTRHTRYGGVDYVRSLTVELANLCGCSNRLHVVEHLTAESIGSADIVTNSGHVRPISASMIALMTTAIPLMYESREFRASDLDLDACLEHLHGNTDFYWKDFETQIARAIASGYRPVDSIPTENLDSNLPIYARPNGASR
jgi:hypothetical protein